MIKSILVPIDDSIYSEIALNYAIDITKIYKAKIEFLNVIDVKLFEDQHFHGIFAALGTKPFPEFKIKLQQALDQRAKKILERAAKHCEKRKVRFEESLITGILPEVITKESKKVDLIVMGARGESAPHKSQFLGSTVEEVTRLAHKPVMITHRRHAPIKRVLMAYDGSLPSNEALKVAADFASKALLSIVLLNVSRDKEAGKAILAEAEKYLKTYRIKFESVITGSDPSKVILDTARKKMCDMIFMGGYGHAKFYELILGSTTEQVMRKATVPVLLYK